MDHMTSPRKTPVSSTTTELINKSLEIALPKTVENLLPVRLPVLDRMLENAKAKNIKLDNYIIVCGQHHLNTTTSIIDFFLKLNAAPENIFIVGKSYSNNKEVIDWLKKTVRHTETSEQEEYGLFIEAYKDDIRHMWTDVMARISALQAKKTAIDGVIILDDGGHVLAATPSKKLRAQGVNIVAIEQTTSGIDATKTKRFPIIMVASSAVKNQVEPQMVADVIGGRVEACVNNILSEKFIIPQPSPNAEMTLKKVAQLTSIQEQFKNLCENKNNIVFGIVGFGFIGKAVMKQLIGMGYRKFIVMDKDQANREAALPYQTSADMHVITVEKLENLIGNAHIIIGCTGVDITQDKVEAFKALSSPKILFSCSSKDVEFLSLLKYIESSDERRNLNSAHALNVLDDITFKNGFQSPILILRGGFPINFDNSPISVKECDIELIRGLKVQAVLQAKEMIEKNKETAVAVQNYMLDPERQQQTMDLWIQLKRPSKKEYYERFIGKFTREFIIENSGGKEFCPRTLSPKATPASPSYGVLFQPTNQNLINSNTISVAKIIEMQTQLTI
jgi:S-adenosylhomocysteine hydrolase